MSQSTNPLSWEDGAQSAADSAADPASAAVQDTKQRLLEAAVRLFAENGFEGTSMRAVTQAAGASVSAANYHFGSKEELLRAGLRMRVEPINARRLELLDAVEHAAGGRAPGVEAIVDAFLRAPFEVQADAVGHGRGEIARRVAARLYVDPPEHMVALKRELFGPVLERFSAALARALPGASPALVTFLQQITAGTLLHVMSGQVDAPVVEAIAGAEAGDSEQLLQTLVVFASAGIRAAAEAESDSPHARAAGRPR